MSDESFCGNKPCNGLLNSLMSCLLLYKHLEIFALCSGRVQSFISSVQVIVTGFHLVALIRAKSTFRHTLLHFFQ